MRASAPLLPSPALTWRVFLPLALVALVFTLAATLLFDHGSAHTSLFALANLVGPTTDSLVHHNALLACTDAMGTPGNPICFHSARMPLPSVVVGLGYTLFGNHYLVVGLFKSILLVLPLALTLWIVSRRLALLPRSPAPAHHVLIAVLLLVPFLLTPFLADVVNLQVEEGYAYSLLALAFALLIFLPAQTASPRTGLLFGLSVALLYLSKSSLLPAVALLTLAFLVRQRRRRTAVTLALLLALLAPAGWALWQHHAGGRYTLGTSLDGINLHKGNNPAFLDHYPPAAGENLDQFDSTLNRGYRFNSEWQFDSFHREAALLFIEQHPGPTLHGDLRKLVAILFTLRKLGSEPAHGVMRLVETAGILVFRILLWTALLASALSLTRRRSSVRFATATFLLLVAAVALPYLAGFAYTRHVSLLIYPSCLLCVRLLLPPDPLPRPQYTRHKPS